MFDINGLISGAMPIGSAISGQSIVGPAGTGIVSADCIDLGPSGRDAGFGASVDFVFRVVTAFTGLTSLRVELIQASDAALTTGIVPRGVIEVPVALLTSGAVIYLPLALELRNIALPRFLGARYTPLGTASTAGSILGGLSRGYSMPYSSALTRSGFAVS